MKTIKGKLMLVVLTVFVVQAILIGILSDDIYQNYKAMQLSECRAKVEQQTTEMMMKIALFREKTQSMAHLGRLEKDKPMTWARLNGILLETLQGFEPGIGGGIWYEPYRADRSQYRMCSYLFRTENGYENDAAFQSDAYDYHHQIWYRQIKEQLLREHRSYGWTQPYRDAAGSNQWMITVGAGIYDETGSFSGMTTVDWIVDDLIADFAKIKPTKNSVILLYGRNGVSMIDDGGIENITLESGSFDEAFYEKIEHDFSDDMKVVIYAPKEEIFSFVRDSMRMTVTILSIACLLIVILLYRLLYVLINRPVKNLAQTAQIIGAGNFDIQVEAETDDELGSLAKAFNKMTENIKAHVKTIAAITTERERLSAELQIAKSIQSSMLPCLFPAFPERSDIDIFAVMHPAREVGGDFYDFFLVDENHIALVIADVSGKGVPAALFMVIAKTLLKNQGMQKESPEKIFASVNNQLCENNDASMFVTAFLGIFDLQSGVFCYVNGGHNPPYWCKASGEISVLPQTGDVILAGVKDMAYHEQSVTLQTGDKLFLYTDGVTESLNGSQEMFGEQRLAAVLAQNVHLSPQALIDRVKKEVDAFVEGGEPFDDITMLAMEYCKEKA